MSLKNCLIVLWVYIMYGLGMWTFFSGYLLKRIVVHQNSSEVLNVGWGVKCGDFSSLKNVVHAFDENNPFRAGTESSPNITLKRYDKAVFIIIDALRYDFTVMKRNSSAENSHYVNKMPVFQDIVDKQPDRAVLRELLADPPTTTLQRLAGITTGSLPTFIDISLNFASTEVQDDNLIRRLNSANKSIVFMGDDTWDSIFPGQFLRSYPFPSFNVKDLDTVDNGILSMIYNEMDRNDWDVIIAHFLGVDHCGHRYGPNHSAMSAKLKQMDEMIRNVTERLSEDTLLVVLGDHGMTETGDHGGDSAKEVSTALFMYSSSGVRKVPDHPEETLPALQIDLVPTFAMLLGLPIPFSNLGSILQEPFIVQSAGNKMSSCFDEKIDSLIGRTIAGAENAYQIQRYLHEYSTASGEMPSLVLEQADMLLLEISVLWKTIDSDVKKTEQTLNKILSGYRNYLSFVQNECRKVWATFNIEKMSLGSLIFGCAVLANLVSAHGIEVRRNAFTFLVCVSACTAVTVLYFYSFCAAVFLCIIICYAFRIHICDYAKHASDSFLNSENLPFFIAVLMFLSSFSNSFVVLEDRVILFFTQALIVYQYLGVVGAKCMSRVVQIGERSKKTKNSSQKITVANCILVLAVLILLLAVRFGSIFYRCREEQPWCNRTVFMESRSKASSSSGEVAKLCVSWFSVISVVATAVIAANSIVPKKNYTAAMICINYGLIFGAVFICLHWWLSVLPSAVLERILAGNEVIGARSAIVISLTVFITCWFFPLLPEKPWESQTNHVFSGSLCLFGFSFLLPLYLTAGDKYALSMTLMVTTQVAFLTLDSLLYDTAGSSLNLKVLLWYLLSCHWFYGTGHQPVFPAIQWDSAFVLSKGVSSYILSGALVMLNTYSSQIVHGISLPLLLLWSQSVKDPSKPLMNLMLHYTSLYGIKLLGAMTACFILRRHLMVWKIFTPKLIYESIGMFVVMISTFLSYIFILRVTSCFHKQIRKNVSQLWCQKEK